MKITLKAALAAVCLLGTLGAAQAAPTLLGTVSKDYGSDPGKDKWSGFAGTCDTLNANSVTVKDSGSGCQRFWDVFNFSALNFESISYFELTLSYSDVGTGSCIAGIVCSGEYWTIRPASSGTVATAEGNATADRLQPTGSGSMTTTFVINGTKYADVFNTIVSNKQFHLWFAERTSGADQFDLSTASLAVYGEPVPTAVPEPGSLALVGLALVGLGAARRVRKA